MISSLHPAFYALGFTLVHFTWQGAIIAVVYKVAGMAMPKLKPQGQYTMGLIALLAMAGVACITFVFETLRMTQAAVPAVRTAFETSVRASFDAAVLLPWLDTVWLLGVVVLSLRMLIGLWRIHRLSIAARPVSDVLSQRFTQALARFNLTGRVHLRVHALIDGPFVVGVLRSVVYLPLSAISTLAPDQLDAVIAHELEHIRRADFAWNLLQTVIETLFFYHPAVWWIGAKLREDRELCCDDAAVGTCHDPMVYAMALLSLAEQRKSVPSLAIALNGDGSGSSLLARVGRILGETVDVSRPAQRSHIVVALPLAILAMTAFLPPVTQVVAQVRVMPVVRMAEAVVHRHHRAAAKSPRIKSAAQSQASSVDHRANGSSQLLENRSTRARADAAASSAAQEQYKVVNQELSDVRQRYNQSVANFETAKRQFADAQRNQKVEPAQPLASSQSP